MSTLIVYDSVFGNTAIIARAIATAREASGPVRLLSIAEARNLDLGNVDLLIVGSPTRGFNPTPDTAEFLAALPQCKGLRAAAFDTRMAGDDIHPAPLRWVVEAGGYAAKRIAHKLGDKGYDVVAEDGFLVGGQEGPLKPGEVERASTWAASL